MRLKVTFIFLSFSKAKMEKSNGNYLKWFKHTSLTDSDVLDDDFCTFCPAAVSDTSILSFVAKNYLLCLTSVFLLKCKIDCDLLNENWWFCWFDFCFGSFTNFIESNANEKERFETWKNCEFLLHVNCINKFLKLKNSGFLFKLEFGFTNWIESHCNKLTSLRLYFRTKPKKKNRNYVIIPLCHQIFKQQISIEIERQITNV